MTTIPAAPETGSALRRHQVFGRIGLILSFMPWLAYGLVALLHPG
jgi:hypothetical protein